MHNVYWNITQRNSMNKEPQQPKDVENGERERAREGSVKINKD